jgi:6-phosphofructokinase 1
MGRSSGFIAAYATMASGDVDLCLLPEAPIELHGARGCLPHLERRVAEKGYAVVVVAEGAGEELLGANAETDASGNKKLPKVSNCISLSLCTNIAVVSIYGPHITVTTVCTSLSL